MIEELNLCKEPAFPNVEIDIKGPSGNAFVIISIIMTKLSEIGKSEEEIEKVKKDMMSSNYEHLLEVASKYVSIKE